MPNPPSRRGSRSSAIETPGPRRRTGKRLPDEATIASIHLVPGYLVRRLHFICQRIFSDALGVSGMLPGHMGLLATLDAYPDIDQRTLGAIIGSDPVTVGQLLDLLERRGHVARTVDPADRRARRLSLTPSGRALFLAMKPRARAALRRQVAPLPPEERKQFIRPAAQTCRRPPCSGGHDGREGRWPRAGTPRRHPEQTARSFQRERRGRDEFHCHVVPSQPGPTSIATTIALLGAASDGWAWPTRPVVLMTSSSPGSPVDLAARLVAEGLTSRLGQPFVVENRPGADGIIALEAIKAASPDGHHLLMTNIGALTVNPLLYAKLPYDPERDFTPVTIVAGDTLVVTTSTAFGTDTLEAALKKARARPLAYNWAAAPGGTHLTGLQILRKTDTPMTFIPYRSLQQAAVDLGEDRVQLLIAPLVLVLPQVQSGKVRLLAVLSEQRSPLAPGIATIGEAGYPDLASSGAISLFGPAGMPAEVVTILGRAVASVLADAEVARRLEQAGMTPVGTGPKALAERRAADAARWARVAREHGVAPAN